MGIEESGEGHGLYIHVPFCRSRCGYCDFYSTTNTDAQERWVAAVLSEAELRSGSNGPCDTVYIGGGTPSLLSPESLGRTLAGLRRRLPVADAAGVTLEVNPDDVERDLVRAWRDHGVDRISVGIQSFDDAELRLLGRRHDSRRADRAVRILREAGFEDIGLDLLFGIPGADPDTWHQGLRRALEHRPEHLSCYELTVEPHTPIGRDVARGALCAQAEESLRCLFLGTHEILTDAGYEHYEVSSYARGREWRSRHNVKYWHRVPYLGLGPSAHSFDGRRRWWNPRSLRRWLTALERGGDPAEDVEALDTEQRHLEVLMLGLRTSDGVSLAAARDAGVIDETVDALVDQGLLRVTGGRIRPTLEGLLFADDMPLWLTTA